MSMSKSKLIHLSAAVIGSTVLAGAAYYYWFRKSSDDKKEVVSETLPIVEQPQLNESRVVAGVDEEHTEMPMDLFRIEDDRIREVFERLFLEQISLGEELMNDDETLERGAVHLANAIALTGEAEKLLGLLRQTFPIAKYTRILKYMPTADLRVNQLLQEEFEDETISAIFG